MKKLAAISLSLACGVVLAAAYLLWLYQRVFFGTVTNPTGTFSNRSSETFATVSGIASATRLGRVPRLSNTRRSASETARGSAIFDAFSDGLMAPGGSKQPTGGLADAVNGLGGLCPVHSLFLASLRQ